MKKLIAAICFLLSVVAVEAQTIHWITFIDTNDENVGKIDVLGRKVLYSHFVNEVNAALAPLGYNSDIQDFYGDRVTPENCKSSVEIIKATLLTCSSTCLENSNLPILETCVVFNL